MLSFQTFFSFFFYCGFLLLFSFSLGKKSSEQACLPFFTWFMTSKPNLSLLLSAFTCQRASSTELNVSTHSASNLLLQGQLKGRERKRRIGRLLFRLLQHLKPRRQAWTRNAGSNPLTCSRITVSFCLWGSAFSKQTYRVADFGPAELHLSCITAVPGAKLASGNTKPLVDLSQHVAGDVLRTSRSKKEENFSNNVMDAAWVQQACTVYWIAVFIWDFISFHFGYLRGLISIPVMENGFLWITVRVWLLL